MIFTSRPFALSALQHWSHFGPSASRAALYREVTPHEKHLEQEFILMGKPRIASPGCRRAREELTGDGGIHFQYSQNEHSPLCNKAPSCSTTASRGNSRVGLFFTKRYVTATEIIWWVTRMLKFVNKQHSCRVTRTPFVHDFVVTLFPSCPGGFKATEETCPHL